MDSGDGCRLRHLRLVIPTGFQRECAGWPFAGGSAQCGRDRVSPGPPRGKWLCQSIVFNRGADPLRSPQRQDALCRRGMVVTQMRFNPLSSRKDLVRA